MKVKILAGVDAGNEAGVGSSWMDFRRKAVPPGGETEFGSTHRRCGCGSDPLIKEKSIKVIIIIIIPGQM